MLVLVRRHVTFKLYETETGFVWLSSEISTNDRSLRETVELKSWELLNSQKQRKQTCSDHPRPE